MHLVYSFKMFSTVICFSGFLRVASYGTLMRWEVTHVVRTIILMVIDVVTSADKHTSHREDML